MEKINYDWRYEPKGDYLCIDLKSFYASYECVTRGFDPLTKMLVVMSNAENAGGLILSASPMAKKRLGISNVSRKYDLPKHPDLVIVPPQMEKYLKENLKINQLFQEFVAKEDLLIYSIDESFLYITPSLKYFNKTPFQLAVEIKQRLFQETKLHCTIGIGDNPLLAKLAMDIEAKHTKEMIACWHYQDVPQKLWPVTPLTEMWGIGSRLQKRLNQKGITTVYDLAHSNPYALKEDFGVMGWQLYAHAWGVDRTSFYEKDLLKETKSFGNSQVLTKDYDNQHEIELVLLEIADQVATRLRKHHVKTQCIQLFLGFSLYEEKKALVKQRKITATNQSATLRREVLALFQSMYDGGSLRQLGLSYSQLVKADYQQLSLFQNEQENLQQQRLDEVLDKIRKKYGFKSIYRGSSLEKGATALSRASLIGGHAGGLEGINEKGEENR